jgi:hypothetical protein
LLLGVPIMVAIKAVCERIEDLRPIAAFLGRDRATVPGEEVQVPSGQ